MVNILQIAGTNVQEEFLKKADFGRVSGNPKAFHVLEEDYLGNLHNCTFNGHRGQLDNYKLST